jgi:hypothetical protein
MSSDKDTKIRAALVFEIIGHPKEFLIETLEKIIEEINKEKGTKVVDKKINEPIFMKDRTDFYTDFAEVEVEVDEIFNLVILMFKYMPSHVEVISPENIFLSNSGWTDMMTEITRRLHAYDEMAKILTNEKMILEAKLREILTAQQEEKQKPETKTIKKVVKKKK